MIIGAYYLTEHVEGAPGEGRVVRVARRGRAGVRRSASRSSRPADDRTASLVSLHATIKVRMPATGSPRTRSPSAATTPTPRRSSCGAAAATATARVLVETTLGRLLFNEAFPPDFPFRDDVVQQARRHRARRRARRPATRGRWWPRASTSSRTSASSTRPAPASRSRSPTCARRRRRPSSSTSFEGEADKVEQQYDRGIITDDERRQKEIEIWTEATDQVREAMQDELVAETVQPHRDDGGLGCPRQRHAGAPDRRHARPGGQPAG